MPALHDQAKREFIEWVLTNIDKLKDKNMTMQDWAKTIGKDSRVVEKILDEIKYLEIAPEVRFLPSTVPVFGYHLDPSRPLHLSKEPAYQLASTLGSSYGAEQVPILTRVHTADEDYGFLVGMGRALIFMLALTLGYYLLTWRIPIAPIGIVIFAVWGAFNGVGALESFVAVNFIILSGSFIASLIMTVYMIIRNGLKNIPDVDI